MVSQSNAQVLRIGGFDFNATARLEGVYSSNVERLRPDATTGSGSLDDYYIVAGLDLSGQNPVSGTTTVNIDTGMAIEKHFKRDDLDNSQNPFGHFGLQTETQIGRVDVTALADYRRTSQSQTDAFSPQGLSKARDPRDEVSYGAGASYEYSRLQTAVDYVHKTETHDLEQFANQNREEDTITASLGYRISDKFIPNYKYDKTDTVYPDNPDSSRIQTNHRFLLPFQLWDEPNLLYTFTWQREDRGDGSPVEWKPRNTVSLGDTLELTPTLTFGYSVQYDNYPQPAQDQIQFTYGANLRHQISRTADHEAKIQRRPVATLGSTLETDQTSYSYQFNKTDLFIYNLNLSAEVSLEHSIPQGDESQPAQDTLRYQTTLGHSVNITRRLSRTLSYEYSSEEVNTQPDKTVEHRITLGYDYAF